jgi:hypothetical protein
LPAGAELHQHISMLMGHKAPLRALYPPAPCLAINIRVFIDFLVDPPGSALPEPQGM